MVLLHQSLPLRGGSAAKLMPKGTPPTPTTSWDELIKAYPDIFEGIGKFPSTYQISLQDDARPVVHAPMEVPHSHDSPGT